jgi:peptidoglycan/xylan/chitin deacetylase (PgdA/CDA1 family)
VKNLYLIPLSLLLLPLAHSACPDGRTHQVHFTFDDGPHSVLTPKILDILKEEGVPATFFVLGKHFQGGKANPSTKKAYDLLDRMKAEGHKIGSHTYEHINHPKYSPDEVRDNIMKPNPLLKDYLSPVLRLPYGAGYFRSSNPTEQAKNEMVMKTVKDAGFRHVAWDIDTNDWDERKRPQLLPTLLRDICRYKGGVVLMHDIQKFTADNLRTWIRAVKAEGHTFAPMERFVPEASNPLPPEACEDATAKVIEPWGFWNQVQQVLRKSDD